MEVLLKPFRKTTKITTDGPNPSVTPYNDTLMTAENSQHRIKSVTKETC